MSERPIPPRLAVALLRICLPRDARGDSVLGDLIEEYGTRAQGARRDLWFALHAIRLCVEYGLWQRVRRAGRTNALRAVRAQSGSGAWLDVRHALRTLIRRPTYLLAGVVTLALGIGADTAIFSVVWNSVLRPLPYPAPDQLVLLGDHPAGESPRSLWSMNVANFLELRDRTRAFDGMAAFEYRSLLLGGQQEAAHVMGLRVTEDFFDVLGRPPVLGRDFLPSDDVSGAQPVVVLSDALWRNRFAADPSIIGGTISIDLVPHLVIGVAPPDLAWRSGPLLWIPFAWDAETRAQRRRRTISAVGRLASGQTIESGTAELRTVFNDIRSAHPEPNERMTVGAQNLHEWTVGWGRNLMKLLGGAAALVLLIACVNVANLMLARAESRRSELAMRRALGAGRFRAGWVFVSEALLLALLGGAFAIPIAYGGVKLLLAIYGASIPRAPGVQVSGFALAFACAASILTGLLVGLTPALVMDARRVPDLLRGAGRGNVRGSGRVQNALVVLEVALGVVIVAAAGLLVNTALRLARVDLGVQTRDALVFRVTLPETRYGAAGAATNFFESLTRELSTLPAVTAVGLGTREPLSGGTNGNFATSRDADATHLVEMRAVSPAWFDATGQRLVAGRLLTPADARSADALVVNEKLARSLFGPGVAAIGQELRATWTEGRWTIVGIVSDVRDFGPAEDARPTAYWSFGGDVLGTTSMAVVVRTASDARGNTLQLVRERLRSLDADLPVSDPATMTELAHLTIGQERRTSLSLVASFALLGLVLAALGIYAVIAFSVEERRREMGVRMALGATGRAVLGLVCSRALRLAAIGVVIGIAGALLTGRLVAHLLWHVRPADPLTLSATAAVFFFAALLGSMLPARRAVRVGVADVLRQD